MKHLHLKEKYGNINFLVISKDEEKENYINAYLNMINYKSIVPIYMGLRKVNFNYKGIITNIQIIYSEAQGKAELKKIFNNEYFEQWYSRYKWDTFIKNNITYNLPLLVIEAKLIKNMIKE